MRKGGQVETCKSSGAIYKWRTNPKIPLMAVISKFSVCEGGNILIDLVV